MKVFALVGLQLKGSLSPFLHQALFRRGGLPHVYIPLEVEKEQLPGALALFRRNLAGFNVTAPLKEEILPYLEACDLSAELYGAVNTVKNEGGRLVGFNTDGYGFLKGWPGDPSALAGQEVLLLGAGGAARSLAMELAHQGCALTIANREEGRAQRLAGQVGRRFPKNKVAAVGLNKIPLKKYYAAINATPLGGGALVGQTPLHSRHLAQIELVYDLIYNPPQTKLLSLAETMGCATVNGLAMLVHQGLRAQEIWLGQSVPEDLVSEIYEEAAKELRQ